MNIGIIGAAGRMGRLLIAEVLGHDGASLVGAVEGVGHAALGQDAGLLAAVGAAGVTVGDDAGALFAAADAVLERWRYNADFLYAIKLLEQAE